MTVTLTGVELAAVLVCVPLLFGGLILALFCLSSRRHPDETGAVPKFEFRSIYLSGSAFMKGGIGIPTTRIALYDEFMAISAITQFKISYEDIESASPVAKLGTRLKFRHLTSRADIVLPNDEAKVFLMGKIRRRRFS